MPFQFKTASTRLKKEAWEKYNQKCAEKGVTPFTDLKQYIEEVLGNESRTELGKDGESNREIVKEIPREANTEPTGNAEGWFW